MAIAKNKNSQTRRQKYAFGLLLGFMIANPLMTLDDGRWITTKKGEKGGGGRRFFIDSETGVILKGGPKRMRGKPLNRAFENKAQRKERYKQNAKAARQKKKEQAEAARKAKEAEQKDRESKRNRIKGAQKAVVTRKQREQANLAFYEKFKDPAAQATVINNLLERGLIHEAGEFKTNLQMATKVAERKAKALANKAAKTK